MIQGVKPTATNGEGCQGMVQRTFSQDSSFRIKPGEVIPGGQETAVGGRDTRTQILSASGQAAHGQEKRQNAAPRRHYLRPRLTSLKSEKETLSGSA